MKKLYKIFLTIAAAFMIGATVIPSSTSVIYANSVDGIATRTDTVSDEEKHLTDVIQYILDNAVVYGQDGLVKNIDFNAIYEKYGYSDELAHVEKIVNDDLSVKSSITFRANIGHCAVVAIQDTLGVSAVSSLLSGGIVGLLQRKAAAEIAKLILKVGLKNVAPAAAAASLVWSFGRCMWF